MIISPSRVSSIDGLKIYKYLLMKYSDVKRHYQSFYKDLKNCQMFWGQTDNLIQKKIILSLPITSSLSSVRPSSSRFFSNIFLANLASSYASSVVSVLQESTKSIRLLPSLKNKFLFWRKQKQNGMLISIDLYRVNSNKEKIISKGVIQNYMQDMKINYQLSVLPI